jgi:YVTN family beta-propeller protein
VAVIDPASNRVVADVAVGGSPTALAVGDGSIWTLNTGEQTISRIDIQTRERVRTISAGSTASDIAFSGDAIWVANAATDTISALETLTGAVESQLRLRIPHGRTWFVPPRISLASNGRRIWATGGDLTTVVIDAVSRRVVRRLSAPPGLASDRSPGGPHIAIGPAGVWATDGQDELLRVDVSPPTSVKLGGFGQGEVGIMSVAVGHDVWAPGGADTLWKIGSRFATPEGKFSVGAGPLDVVIGGGSIWTANAFDGTVSRLDPQSGHIATIQVGGSPRAVAFAGGLLWVSVD